MPVDVNELIQRYTDYKAKNNEIKRRQAKEREAELEPFLADVGRTIAGLREAGHGMPYLADLINNYNRNFLYDALRAFKRSDPEYKEPDKSKSKTKTPKRVPKRPKEPEVTKTRTADSGGYTLSYNADKSVTVFFPTGTGEGEMYRETSTTLVRDADGDWVFPSEWFTTADEDAKTLYRTIIRDLEAD